MGKTINLRSSAEFAQYQRNAFKCSLMLGSLWALINTCKSPYLPALYHGERGGITVRQRRSSRQSQLNLWFAHEWACHLCLPGGTWWGWDKGRTSGWQAEWGPDLQHQDSSTTDGRERPDQIPEMTLHKPETVVLLSHAPHLLSVARDKWKHVFNYVERKTGIKIVEVCYCHIWMWLMLHH